MRGSGWLRAPTTPEQPWSRAPQRRRRPGARAVSPRTGPAGGRGARLPALLPAYRFFELLKIMTRTSALAFGPALVSTPRCVCLTDPVLISSSLG